MPALNFMARFAPKVESGEKRQTIRARRKDGRDPKPGQTLYLYTGMRQRGCRKLGEAVCKSVEYVEIGARKIVIVDNRVLTEIALEALAFNDGFESFDEMYSWFRDKHGLPFCGRLIRWGALR